MASHPTQPNEQRRRLLKAASAAPVIFTLPVGQRVAAQSIHCEVQQIISTKQYNELDSQELQDDYIYIGDDPLAMEGEDYVNKHDSCWASIGALGLPD